MSAVALTLALVDLGEPEQARWLGQDTVEWCRRMLGPDHPTTLLVAQIAGVSHSPTVADDPGGGAVTSLQERSEPAAAGGPVDKASNDSR